MKRDRLAFLMYQLLCYYARKDAQPKVRQPGTRRFWAQREDAIMRLHYPHEDDATLQSILRRSRTQIYARANVLGLHKSVAYMQESRAQASARLLESGKAFRFPKGSIPPNKGQKGIHHSPATEFKKGNRPQSWKPIGTYRINADGYLDRKITDEGLPKRRWVGVHRLVWMQHHGPIPPGHIVCFKDGMRTTALEEITVDRLELITLAENMRRNTFHNWPKPLAQLVQLRGALVRQINRRHG